jgi:hypothetical protein
MTHLKAALLTLILTIAFIAPADARRHRAIDQEDRCDRFPNSILCEDEDYDADDEDEDVFIPRRRLDNSCRGIARWLAYNYDFRRIEINDCGGRNYGYTAVRGRWVYLVKVDSRTRRIISSIRLRRSRF